MNRFLIAFGLAILATGLLQADEPATAVKAVGVLEPVEVVEVAPRSAGVINKVFVDFNAKVKQGEMLAELDATSYRLKLDHAQAAVALAQAKLQMAKAKVNIAQREYERAAKLATTGAVDKASIDAVQDALDLAKAAILLEEAGVVQARATHQGLQLDLDGCRVASPVEGVVLDRRCTAGQMVVPGTAATATFVLATDLRKMQVVASVSEADIGRVAAGQAAQFTVEAFPGEMFTGRVRQIRWSRPPELDARPKPERVTYRVIIDVDNKDGKLLPYMTAQVGIALGAK